MDLDGFLSGPASCLPDACFCEQLGEGVVKQPANTWSSFAFVIVGGWLLWAPQREMPRMLVWAYAACVVAVGIASAIFHAGLTFIGQWLDVSSMYAFAALLGWIHLGVLGVGSPKKRAIAYGAITFATSVLGMLMPVGRRVVFDVLLLLALVSLWRVARTVWSGVPRLPLFAAVALLVTASAAWVLDMRHIWCDPPAMLQGHAAWHVLGALATACIFSYYRAGFEYASAVARRARNLGVT